MLYTSTKNVAYEVISCLIIVDNNSSSSPEKGSRYSNKDKDKDTATSSANEKGTVSCKGVLTDIIKWLTITNQH